MMVLPDSLSAMHNKAWQQFVRAHAQDKIGHATLLVGPRHAKLLEFCQHLSALLLCHEKSSAPCGHCRSCTLFKSSHHPDYMMIQPEQEGGMIKVGAIRALQKSAYQTAHVGERRVVCLAADRMNLASANALLKVLEEPPESLRFILIAEQLETIPATIVSRCQKWFLTGAEQARADYTELGTFAEAGSSRAALYDDRATIAQHLAAITACELSPSEVAEVWAKYDFDDLLWFLYLITAQLIRIHCFPNDALMPALKVLQSKLDIYHLYEILTTINRMRERILHHANMNTTLAIEALLIEFTNKDMCRG